MASGTLARVKALVAEGKVRVSDHGYDDSQTMIFWLSTCSTVSNLRSWLRITPNSRRDRAFLCFSGMPLADPYMSFGAFRRAVQNRPLW